MRRLMLTLIANLIATAAMLIPGVASAGSPGWIVKCPYSPNNHSLYDDPIVFPGTPGASHLHDFFGAKKTNASSTYVLMQAGGTTCAFADDTSGYWVPALYEDEARILAAGTRQKFYYRENTGTPVNPFPPDFRMIAGNAHAKSEAENPKLGSSIYWGCSDNSTDKLKTPPSCSTGKISLHVGFPSCGQTSALTGVVLDSLDHKSHVAYPKSGTCPSTHPVRLPRLIMRFEYPVGTTTGNITLASGPPYTAHGDFWNTWNQKTLESLVTDCLGLTPKDCGQF